MYVVYCYLSYLVGTCGYLLLPARCGVTWDCRTLGCIHGVLVNTGTTITCAITIIVQWIHCIVALPELPLLPVTWACNLTASPPYLARFH